MIITYNMLFIVLTSGVLLIGVAFKIYRLNTLLKIQRFQNQQTEEKLAALQTIEAENKHFQEALNRYQTQQALSAAELEQQVSQNLTLTEKLHSLELQRNELEKAFNQNKLELAEQKVTSQKDLEASEQKLALLESAKQQLANEFKVLANQIFESKQASMSDHSKEIIGSLMQPMQTALEGFKTRVELVHKEDIEGRASLIQQLKQLQTLNNQMTDEAKNLTQALKGDAKLQGNWGELILEKLLESTGLREGVEFVREKQLTDSEGKRFRPDVILNLPDAKHIIIDSKVSLTAYEKAVNTDEQEAKIQAIKNHITSLRRHIEALSTKRYDHLEGINSADFVLMFIPVEGAYLLAIESDPGLFEKAFEQKIAVVTPTTLFTTLKTIEQLWRYERQSEHTVALIKRAADVHDKFVGFVETFEKVGKQLGTAQNSFDQAKKQMMAGSGNLVRQAEMLKELAGKTKKEIPTHLLEEAEGDKLPL